jgi:tungstate transport system substrate-binding protein
MFNPYGIIAVNPAKYKDINIRGANSLIEWMTSAEGQKKLPTQSMASNCFSFV